MNGLKNKFNIIVCIIVVVVSFSLLILQVFYSQYHLPFISRLPFKFWLWVLIVLSGWDILNGLRTGTIYLRSMKGTNKKDNPYQYWIAFILVFVVFFLCVLLLKFC